VVAAEVAGVADEEPAAVGEVVPGLADASWSDIWKVTGNGHPPLPLCPEDAPEPALDGPPSVVEARLTNPTPRTRRRATMVAATADCDAAHPLSWTAEALVAPLDGVVPDEAAAAAAVSAEGEAALKLLSAAFAGITPPI
jgi:hypothetical protein